MTERLERTDTPGPADSPGAGPPRDDLQSRLGQLGDAHPSSGRYQPDRGGPPADRNGDRSADQLPAERDVPLSADRARHILDGDGPGKPGGGHRHGSDRPGKTEFPESWSDQQVLTAVSDVARQPDESRQQRNGKTLASGERDGVRIFVVSKDGTIVTAWPEPGGRGVRQNPKDGGS